MLSGGALWKGSVFPSAGNLELSRAYGELTTFVYGVGSVVPWKGQDGSLLGFGSEYAKIRCRCWGKREDNDDFGRHESTQRPWGPESRKCGKETGKGVSAARENGEPS